MICLWHYSLATICLSIPISTVSAERSFSDMELIKNRLRNRLTELSLSNLMKIVIESPENSLIVIWKKMLMCGIEKVDRLLCKLSFRLLSHYICILSLLMLFVKHLSTSIMNFNNTISRGGGGGGGAKGSKGRQLPQMKPWLVVLSGHYPSSLIFSNFSTSNYWGRHCSSSLSSSYQIIIRIQCNTLFIRVQGW